MSYRRALFALICTVALLLVSTSHVPGVTAVDTLQCTSDSDPFQLMLVGTGFPNPSVAYSGPSTAVLLNGKFHLFDVGPGTELRLNMLCTERNMTAACPEAVRTTFFTHLHSDHTTGVPEFILNSWVLGRDGPIEFYGPPGTEAMVSGIMTAYAADIEERKSSGEPMFPEGYHVDAHDIDAGYIYKIIATGDKDVDGDHDGISTTVHVTEAIQQQMEGAQHDFTVTAFNVRHGSFPHAYGYRIEDATTGKRIVISGS
eukprot:GFYU01026545.1.p1 GENE.GFYU01026545.1~~GFYU01026545.1.p1  ORF type:complete len:266 (+),score=45.59 GFYU01026545.1:29-799(+)